MIRSTRCLISTSGAESAKDCANRVAVLTERLFNSIDGIGEVPLMDTFRILCQKDDLGRVEMSVAVETRYIPLVEEKKSHVSVMMDVLRGD